MIYQTDLLTISDAITTIRQTFDSRTRLRNLAPDADIEGNYLKFESVRFRFSSRLMEARRRGNFAEAKALIGELNAGLSILAEDAEFYAIATEIKLIRRVRARNVPHHPDLSSVINIEPAPSVAEFIDRLCHVIRDGVEFNETVERAILNAAGAMQDASKLKSIVPEQKVSPVQFDIEDGILTVRQQSHIASSGREHIAEAALGELVRRGDGLAQQLRNSNCDRRLLENIEQLQNHLRNSTNIVQIGIANLACDQLAKTFSTELPDALSALLIAHTSSVGMYLSQFSEWRMFTDASEHADLSAVDISALSRALADVAKELDSNPNVASPDVPRTLLALRAFIDDPKKASQKAALSAARTLENLVIKVFGYGAEFIEKSIQKSIDSLSTTASKVLVATLLSAALLAATNLSAFSSGVGGMAWMQDAVIIVGRQIDLLRATGG
tara:strand:+ start:251 stop:1573 length:1323 start_codon:yes stop_codon:yes gene_type:complete